MAGGGFIGLEMAENLVEMGVSVTIVQRPKQLLAPLDADMQTRVRLTPVIYIGPLAFVPMVIIGALLDLYMFKTTNGMYTILLTAIALVFYLLSFIMSIQVLKTEKKAQQRAYDIMKENGMATDEELAMCKKLFRLYNIEYINNMVISLLELVYRVLQIIAYVQNASSSGKS